MKIILLILGMALVTYLPRLIPALFLDRITFPDWARKWLAALPYAALGALIFPGIVTVIPDQPLIGIIAGAAALVLALLRAHVVIVMAGSILAVIGFQLLI